MTRPLVVLASGGLDSTVLLAWALKRGPVVALVFETKARPRGERGAERAVFRHLGLREVHRVHAPTGVADWRQGSASRNYVPGRNLFLHASALLLARRVGASGVAAGHLGSDGRSFRDATPAFFRRLEALANAGRARGEDKLRILTPFLAMDKAAVVRLGRRLGAPLDLTWSCYRDGAAPCGRCVACRERAAALMPAAAR